MEPEGTGLWHAIRDEEREKKQGFYCQGYSVGENEVMWHDFSGSDKNIPIEDIIEKVSTHFPNMELLFWRSWEGPVDYECIIKNGEVTEIESDDGLQEDIMDNCPAPVETKEIEDIEPFPSAEAAASGDLPWWAFLLKKEAYVKKVGFSIKFSELLSIIIM